MLQNLFCSAVLPALHQVQWTQPHLWLRTLLSIPYHHITTHLVAYPNIRPPAHKQQNHLWLICTCRIVQRRVAIVVHCVYCPRGSGKQQPRTRQVTPRRRVVQRQCIAVVLHCWVGAALQQCLHAAGLPIHRSQVQRRVAIRTCRSKGSCISKH